LCPARLSASGLTRRGGAHRLHGKSIGGGVYWIPAFAGMTGPGVTAVGPETDSVPAHAPCGWDCISGWVPAFAGMTSGWGNASVAYRLTGLPALLATRHSYSPLPLPAPHATGCHPGAGRDPVRTSAGARAPEAAHRLHGKSISIGVYWIPAEVYPDLIQGRDDRFGSGGAGSGAGGCCGWTPISPFEGGEASVVHGGQGPGKTALKPPPLPMGFAPPGLVSPYLLEITAQLGIRIARTHEAITASPSAGRRKRALKKSWSATWSDRSGRCSVILDSRGSNRLPRRKERA
jgi:hypothetical protein